MFSGRFSNKDGEWPLSLGEPRVNGVRCFLETLRCSISNSIYFRLAVNNAEPIGGALGGRCWRWRPLVTKSPDAIEKMICLRGWSVTIAFC